MWNRARIVSSSGQRKVTSWAVPPPDCTDSGALASQSLPATPSTAVSRSLGIRPRGAHGRREPDHVDEEDAVLAEGAVVVEEDHRLALHLRDVAEGRRSGKLGREAIFGGR